MDIHLVVHHRKVKDLCLSLGDLTAVQGRLEQVEHPLIVPVQGELQLVDVVADLQGGSCRAVDLGALGQLSRLFQGGHELGNDLGLGLAVLLHLQRGSRLGVHRLDACDLDALGLLGGLQQIPVGGEQPLAAPALHGGCRRALHHQQIHPVGEDPVEHHTLHIGQLLTDAIIDVRLPHGHQVIPHLDAGGINDGLGVIVGVSLYLHLVDPKKYDTGCDHGRRHRHQREQLIEQPKPAPASFPGRMFPLTCHANHLFGKFICAEFEHPGGQTSPPDAHSPGQCAPIRIAGSPPGR